jgi:hypothetical protein
MPRAALLSIHARMEGTQPLDWDDPALVQVWGPRFSVYAIAQQDRAIFTLGRHPDDPKRRKIAEELADGLEALLGGSAMPFGEAARALAQSSPNSLRYATTTGRVLIRWDGARQPNIWTVPPPDVDPADARLELARRHVHIFGPTTPEAFGRWAGIKPTRAFATFEALDGWLTPVQTPIGDAFILSSDEAEMRMPTGPEAPARLLPSGDAYYLHQGDDRELLVPDPRQRDALWTSRVWPGALLVNGEIVGTWRRSQAAVTVTAWRTLTAAARSVVEMEASSLPLPGVEREIIVKWET